MREFAIIVSAAVLAFAIPFAALARDGEAPVDFQFSRSETASFEGAQALFDRIEAHSRRSCLDASLVTTPRRQVSECANDLVRQFVEAIDSPLLYAAARADRPDIRLAVPRVRDSLTGKAA